MKLKWTLVYHSFPEETVKNWIAYLLQAGFTEKTVRIAWAGVKDRYDLEVFGDWRTAEMARHVLIGR